MIDYMNFENLITVLPKSELHLHLRGTISCETILKLVKKNKVKLDECIEFKEKYLKLEKFKNFFDTENYEMKEIRNLITFSDFDDFIKTYGFIGWFIKDIEDLDDMLIDLVAYLKENNIIYAEVIITLGDYIRNGISLASLLYTLNNYGNKYNVKWILDTIRSHGPENSLWLLDSISKLNKNVFSALTLGGDENSYPTSAYYEVYKTAKKLGMHLNIHAGEKNNCSNIWDAIKLLKVERIGHGIAACNSKELMLYLSKEKIPLEICINSNLATGVVNDIYSHPIRNFLKYDVPISLNTDDPTFFKTNLNNEYIILKKIFNLKNSQIFKIIMDGFDYSYLEEEEKLRLKILFSNRLNDLGVKECIC